MLNNTVNYNYQNDASSQMVLPHMEYNDETAVFAGCRHYSPSGSADIMNMENYTMCDSCRHMRMDNKCGAAERTLM